MAPAQSRQTEWGLRLCIKLIADGNCAKSRLSTCYRLPSSATVTQLFGAVPWFSRFVDHGFTQRPMGVMHQLTMGFVNVRLDDEWRLELRNKHYLKVSEAR